MRVWWRRETTRWLKAPELLMRPEPIRNARRGIITSCLGSTQTPHVDTNPSRRSRGTAPETNIMPIAARDSKCRQHAHYTYNDQYSI